MHRYGYKKDKLDPRDLKHTFMIKQHLQAIKKVDLRTNCPKVYNQGDLGSCTANAVAALYEFDQMKEKDCVVFTPSRLFVYYNERVIEGTINEDSGAELRDGMKTINCDGVCPEQLWGYDEKKFAVRPPAKLYTVAKQHKCVIYKRLEQTLDQLKQCLLEGFPFVFGFTVFQEFENDVVAKTGMVPMPTKDSVGLGGHAVMCVGYIENKSLFIVRNSWGDDWGDHGYFYMPYAYVLSPELSSDFWTATRVDDPPIIPSPKIDIPSDGGVNINNIISEIIGVVDNVVPVIKTTIPIVKEVIGDVKHIGDHVIETAKEVDAVVKKDIKPDIQHIANDVKNNTKHAVDDLKKDTTHLVSDIKANKGVKHIAQDIKEDISHAIGDTKANFVDIATDIRNDVDQIVGDVKPIVQKMEVDVKEDVVELKEDIEKITAQVKCCCIPCCKIVSKQ